MKEELCKVFCDQVSVRQVPIGLAVSTAYVASGGDRIGFYIVGPDKHGQFLVEDDGMVVPTLEASGADFTSDTRQAAFGVLLSEYGAVFDDVDRTIRIPGLTAAQVPEASLKFSALLLRVQDMMLMTFDRVASTFKDEVTLRLSDMFKGKADVETDVAVHPSLSDNPADMVIRATKRDPVAVFIVMSDKRLLQSIMLATEAAYVQHVPCSVVSLIETESNISRGTLNQALSRLSPMFYRGHENDALKGIMKEALGIVPESLH